MSGAETVTCSEAECARHGAQLSPLQLIASRLDDYTWDASPAPVEVPLPEPEGARELVWRPGFGWVERPVEAPVRSTSLWPAMQRGAA